MGGGLYCVYGPFWHFPGANVRELAGLSRDNPRDSCTLVPMLPIFAHGDEAATYARKSKLDPKNPGKSNEDQTTPLVERLEAAGLTVILTEEDENIGASQWSPVKVRKGFLKIMDAIRTRPKLRAVAFWELSRSARELETYAQLIRLCHDQAVFVLINDRWYDPRDPNDRVMLGLNALLDEAEVARLRGRVLRGTNSSAAAGKPHGKEPYGYKRYYHPETKALLEVQIVPEEGAMLRELARRILAGESGRKIEADFNSRGTRRNGQWNQASFKETLLNPTYAGLRQHHEDIHDAIWPAIFDEGTVAQLRRHYGSTTPRNSSAKYVLTGVVWCKKCQVKMYRAPQTGKADRYACQKCSRARHAEHLEDYVLSLVQEWLMDPATRKEIRARQSKGWNGAAELEALEQELEDVYASDVSAKIMEAQEKRLAPRIAALTAERDRFQGTSLVELPDAWPSELEDQRELLRRTIRVEVDAVGKGRGFSGKGIEVIPIV